MLLLYQRAPSDTKFLGFRATASSPPSFLSSNSTSKVHVHCTHEILVVCALCFYMSSLLDSTCVIIWWNVDDIQRPVVLGFAIFVPLDWLHPTTNFQSYGLVCSLTLPRLSLGVPQVCLVAFSSQHSCSLACSTQHPFSCMLSSCMLLVYLC